MEGFESFVKKLTESSENLALLVQLRVSSETNPP